MSKNRTTTANPGEWQYPTRRLGVYDAVHRGDVFQPGMLVEIKTLGEGNKRQVLIGHMNQLGGVCDDCTGYDDEDRVIRWRQVWQP